MKKIISILILLLIFNAIMGFQFSYADDLDDVMESMNGASEIKAEDAGSNISKTINDVIGLIQLTGTGIALVVITILGIKYMLASPSEKAETKKLILPILIGCVLLFGAVNLVAAMADLATTIK